MKALTKQQLMELGIDVSRLENGKYLVRHYGRNARSLNRSLKVIKTSIIYRKHPYGKKKSYKAYVFHECGKLYSIPEQRLVYAWFKDDIPANYDVDHIDGDPMNNRLDNLQLLTRKENLARRTLTQSEITRLYHAMKKAMKKGEQNGR